MVLEVGPLAPDSSGRHADDLAVSGTLIWDETEAELCNLYVRDARFEILNTGLANAFVRVGDIFDLSDTDGLCDPAAVGLAFDQYGPPDEACLAVSTDEWANPITYCAPFPADR